MGLPGAGTSLSTAVVLASVVSSDRNEGQAAGEKGKTQLCSQPCSSFRAHLDISWLLSCVFEPLVPDRHTNTSKFHSQELKVLGARPLLLVQTQRLAIVLVLTSGYSFVPFLREMQLCTSDFFPTFYHPSWCLLPASPQFCQHTVKMLRQCPWLFKMQRDRND